MKSKKRKFLNELNDSNCGTHPAVPYVKCKYRNDISVCILNSIFINENDYCSNGDKLDGDEHDNG